MNPYADEFTAVMNRHLAGKSLAERLRQVQQWQTDLTREGRVPIPNGWVSLTDTAGRILTGQTVPRRGLTPMVRIVGIVLALVLGCGALAVLRQQRSAVDVPSVPVTAAHGATAPVALTVGDTTIPIRRFDPTKGWPNPADTPDAALWGDTTINVVLGVAADAYKPVLRTLAPGAPLTVRRADGSMIAYRLVRRVMTDANAVEYAAQDQNGLTVVAFDGDQRVVFVAVPADLPATTAVLGSTQLAVESAQWQVVDRQRVLAVTLQIAPPVSTPMTVTVDATTVIIPALQTTATMTMTTPSASQVTAHVQDGTTTAPLSIAVPPLPALDVTWTGAYQAADGAVIATATLTPDGPVILSPTSGGCQYGGTGTVQPLQVVDATLPMILTAPQPVVVRCAATPKGGDVTIWMEASTLLVDARR